MLTPSRWTTAHWVVALIVLWTLGCSLAACHGPPVRAPLPMYGGVQRDEALVDLSDDETPVRRSVPRKPEGWQKAPPCDADMGEEVVSGACYAKMARRPPCGRLLEHDGSCYRAIAKPQRQPTSINP